MKKKLEAELKDLANKILKSEIENVSELKHQARELYEKITVLAFTEANLESFSTETPAENSSEKLGKNKLKSEEKVTNTEVASDLFQMERTKPEAEIKPKEEPIPKKEYQYVPHVMEENQEEEEKDDYLPDGTEYNESALIEPNTEKIKDIVANMPPETQKLDYMISNIISKNGIDKVIDTPEEGKTDFRNIGVDYDNLPNFEPVKKQEEQRPRSLNDRLKKGLNIGLNERLAFIRHLFEGKTEDYNRVISQLNTFDSATEAKKFIQLVVKPDYKNWAGKEEYEQKFLDLVENKFKH